MSEKYGPGARFGRLVVAEKLDRARRRCACDCGGKIVARIANLMTGDTRSCGCLRRETTAANGRARRTHGRTRSREYVSWRASINRCHNTKAKDYERYGALGVAVCERWRRSFESFFDDMGPRPPATSLDRINPFGDYEPGNCRWADAKTQASNTRRNFSRGAVA